MANKNFWLNLGDAVKYAHSTSTLDGGGAYYVTSQAKEDLREQGKEDEAKQIEKAETVGTVGGAIVGLTLGKGVPALMRGVKAFRAAHPIISGAIDAGLTVDGVRNALSDNGVKKTINYIKDGNWGRAAASGTIDALDLLGGVGLVGDAVKGVHYLKQVPNFGTFLWDITPNKQMGRRLIEAAMRRSAAAVPRPKEFIAHLINSPDLRKYIITGKLPNGVENAKSYIMGLNAGTLTPFGLFQNMNDGVDYIDAFLYQKPLNPKFMTRVGNATTDAGPLSSYVNSNYASKALQIPVYDTGYGYGLNRKIIPLRQQKVESIGSDSNYPFVIESFPYANGGINVAGHTIEHGILDNYQVMRGWDIWKFNPTDYMKKWVVDPHNPKLYKSKLQLKLYKLGLEYIDAASTPIITRTQWDWHPMYYKLEASPFMPVVEGISYKQGGPIHIKKKNRGKFTDYCGGKVTEECIRKGKNSSNPTTRKRANFAWVARHKFKHEEGGKINYLNYFQYE